jgi:gluconate 2-dehydrogenase gamma chain
MACRSHWEVVPEARLDLDSDEPTFFDRHEWETIEAATARIIPTDHDPGAREAKVVRFIDRYLSSVDHVFASADGAGFLRLDGIMADAWAGHLDRMRQVYRDGVRTLDELAVDQDGQPFAALSDEQQDAVLERLSGADRPVPITSALAGGHAYGASLQSDLGLDFFPALCLHTRQGFYGDPVYGGNHEQVGWQVIGFPGPPSLAATQTCTYSVYHLLVADRDWADLVPHVREQALAKDRA